MAFASEWKELNVELGIIVVIWKYHMYTYISMHKYIHIYKYIYIYVYVLYMGVSKNRGTPKWMVYNGKPY